MKFRNTLILLGVVVILLVYVYVFEIRRPGESAGESKSLGRTLLMEEGNVGKIELIYSDPDYETIVCSKDGDGEWHIEEPLRAKADQKIMDRLVSGSLGKRVQSTLEEPGSMDEYGLKNPRVTARFYLRDDTSRTLTLGHTVPTGNYVYVNQKSFPDVFLVPASIADDLTKFVSDLRDRTVMDLASLDIQKIQLKYATGENITCEKSPLATGAADWELVEPVTAEADGTEVDRIISDVNDLKVGRFIAEEPDDLSVYGLARPQIRAIISTEDGKDRSLLIGRQESGSVYVKVASSNPVFLVGAEVVGKLMKQPSDLRDKTVVDFDRKTIEKLELRYPGRAIACEKKSALEGEMWEITKPVAAKADASQVEELLRKLHELKVDRFVLDESKDPAAYGLNQPQIQVIISQRGVESRGLLLGEEAGELVYARSARAAQVFLVSAGIVDVLSKNPLDLRDKQVMEFRKGDVQRIRLERNDATIVCIRQERDWRILEPVREKAKSYEVDGILNKLDDLMAEEFVVEKAQRLSEYGLGQPDIAITIMFKDDTAKTLLVGKKLPDREAAYAKTADQDVIFIVAKDLIDELGKDLDALLDT